MDKYIIIDNLVRKEIESRSFSTFEEFKSFFGGFLKEIVDTDDYKTVFSITPTNQYVLYLTLMVEGMSNYVNFFTYENYEFVNE